VGGREQGESLAGSEMHAYRTMFHKLQMRGLLKKIQGMRVRLKNKP